MSDESALSDFENLSRAVATGAPLPECRTAGGITLRAALERLAKEKAAARAEGFALARKHAEAIAERCRKERETLRQGLEESEGQRAGERLTWLACKESEAERIRDAIRAMKEG